MGTLTFFLSRKEYSVAMGMIHYLFFCQFVVFGVKLSMQSPDIDTVDNIASNYTEALVVSDRSFLGRAYSQEAWHVCDAYGLHILQEGKFQTSPYDRVNFAPSEYTLLYCDHLQANPLFLRLPFRKKYMDFRIVWNEDLTSSDLFVPKILNKPCGYGLRITVSTFLVQSAHDVFLLFDNLEQLNGFVLAAENGLGTIKKGLDHELLHFRKGDFLQARRVVLPSSMLQKKKKTISLAKEQNVKEGKQITKTLS